MFFSMRNSATANPLVHKNFLMSPPLCAGVDIKTRGKRPRIGNRIEQLQKFYFSVYLKTCFSDDLH